MLYALMRDLADLLTSEFPGTLFVSDGLRPRPSLDELLHGKPYYAWVVPESVKVELSGRGIESRTCKLNVVLLWRIGEVDIYQKDFLDFVERLASWASRLELTPDNQRAVCKAVDIDPTMAIEQLDEGACLTSVISLTFVSYGSPV